MQLRLLFCLVLVAHFLLALRVIAECGPKGPEDCEKGTVYRYKEDGPWPDFVCAPTSTRAAGTASAEAAGVAIEIDEQLIAEERRDGG
jgi:hypothetical protein